LTLHAKIIKIGQCASRNCSKKKSGFLDTVYKRRRPTAVVNGKGFIYVYNRALGNVAH